MSKKTLNILLITGLGGLGDRSYNDAGFEGARQAIKQLDVSLDLVELNEIADLSEGAYFSAAAKKKYDLIIGLGFYQEEPVNLVAKKFPDQKFVLIDARSTEPNVRGILFHEQENAFLAGILAAYVTKTKIIGIILGMDAHHVKRYAYAYEAGAKTINAEIKVLSDVVGNFQDQDRAEKLTLNQIDQGADIVYQVAGFGGLGVFKAVEERGVYAIGEGVNQNYLHPEFIVASTYKNMSEAIFQVVNLVTNHQFQGGNFYCGFRENCLKISSEGSNVSLSIDQKTALEKYKQKIIDGDIIAL